MGVQAPTWNRFIARGFITAPVITFVHFKKVNSDLLHKEYGELMYLAVSTCGRLSPRRVSRIAHGTGRRFPARSRRRWATKVEGAKESDQFREGNLVHLLVRALYCCERCGAWDLMELNENEFESQPRSQLIFDIASSALFRSLRPQRNTYSIEEPPEVFIGSSTSGTLDRVDGSSTC